MNLPSLMKPCEVTKIIPVVEKTLYRWRLAGTGPEYIKVNGRVFYKSESVIKWIDDLEVLCNGN